MYKENASFLYICACMSNLEKFINDDSVSDLDSLVKMCIIHHQFESIHPFFDGNGRPGRIINILNMNLFDLLINAFHVDINEANSQQVETPTA